MVVSTSSLSVRLTSPLSLLPFPSSILRPAHYHSFYLAIPSTACSTSFHPTFSTDLLYPSALYLLSQFAPCNSIILILTAPSFLLYQTVVYPCIQSPLSPCIQSLHLSFLSSLLPMSPCFFVHQAVVYPSIQSSLSACCLYLHPNSSISLLPIPPSFLPIPSSVFSLFLHPVISISPFCIPPSFLLQKRTHYLSMQDNLSIPPSFLLYGPFPCLLVQH